MFRFKITFGLVALFAFATVTAFTQTSNPVSDEELGQFVECYKSMLDINETAQGKMLEAVEEGDMTVERFNEIAESQENPQANVTMDEAENAKYNAIIEDLMKVQMQTQSQMEKVIEDSDLSVDRYQEISLELQSNQELQMRIQMMLQGG